MENVSINLARDLPASARTAVENLLGRSLRDDEEVSVMALDPHPAPSGEARRASAERLRGALDQLALKAQDVADGEVDDAIDEAMNHIRPRRTRGSFSTGTFLRVLIHTRKAWRGPCCSRSWNRQIMC